MNTIQTNNALLVTVPSGAEYQIEHYVSFNVLISTKGGEAITHTLPPGEYEILGLGYDFMDKVNESDRKDIFEAIEANLLNPSTTLILKRKT